MKERTKERIGPIVSKGPVKGKGGRAAGGVGGVGELRHILVCRTDALGDALLAWPVCAALKRAFPRTRVTFLTSAYAAPLFAGQSGPDEVWAYDPDAPLADLVRRVRAAGPDAALLVFPDRWVSWALWRAGVKKRVGTARRWWSFLYTVRVNVSRARGDRHEADLNLDLVRALGAEAKLIPPRLTVAAADRAWARSTLKRSGLRPGDRLVLLHPGGRGSSANWPPERYGQLAGILRQVPRIHLLLTGSNTEQDLLCAAARACVPEPARLTEPVTLPRFAALISEAEVFVSGNTGPMHVASALGVPTVSIFPPAGVTGPARWHPLGRPHIVLTPPEGQGMLGLTAAQAAVAVRGFLAQPRRGPHVRRDH